MGEAKQHPESTWIVSVCAQSSRPDRNEGDGHQGWEEGWFVQTGGSSWRKRGAGREEKDRLGRLEGSLNRWTLTLDLGDAGTEGIQAGSVLLESSFSCYSRSDFKVTNLSNNQFTHIIYLNNQFVSFCCNISKLLVGSNHLLKNWSVSRFWFPGQMGLPMLSGSFCKPLSIFINLHIHPLTDILVLTPCLALICSRSFCQQGCGRKCSQWCIIDRDALTHKDLPQMGV